MTSYMPQIPCAFIQHDDVKFVLDDTLNQFHHDEKEAIFFHWVLGATVNDISKVTSLTPMHIVSALNLYAERLESKLCFFKKFVPHDNAQSLPASELLFEHAHALA
ncbi:MAG: hypothetical protein FWC71_09935 [Defluviitaleaceae bacterium]|nr:hypothetical protein [Defluviitaleaceae bacterium]